ncbi:hypothetical protein [Trinickia dabaoshanensis]|uniref:hypothetical protein n=1 Tax=Trinickia dabaoshanensis TaxID=564714 RepID=UPI0011AF8F4D|nr:hypothetical protein [Trinickia dabaoshanensis]
MKNAARHPVAKLSGGPLPYRVTQRKLHHSNQSRSIISPPNTSPEHAKNTAFCLTDFRMPPTASSKAESMGWRRAIDAAAPSLVPSTLFETIEDRNVSRKSVIGIAATDEMVCGTAAGNNWPIKLSAMAPRSASFIFPLSSAEMIARTPRLLTFFHPKRRLSV